MPVRGGHDPHMSKTTMPIDDVLRAAAYHSEAEWPNDRATIIQGRQELAAQLGVSVTTVYGWDRVPDRHAPRVAAWLGIPLSELRPDLVDIVEVPTAILVNEKGDPDDR